MRQTLPSLVLKLSFDAIMPVRFLVPRLTEVEEAIFLVCCALFHRLSDLNVLQNMPLWHGTTTDISTGILL